MSELLQQVQAKARHDDLVPMTDLACNVVWLKTFIASLDLQENTIYRVQQVIIR